MSNIHTKEIKTAVETAFSIPGLYRHDEAGFLYRLAHAVVDWWHTERDGNRPNWELIGLHDYTIAFRRIA